MHWNFFHKYSRSISWGKNPQKCINGYFFILYRVEEVANRMTAAKKVQNDYEAIKFAIDTTRNSLADLEVSLSNCVRNKMFLKSRIKENWSE